MSRRSRRSRYVGAQAHTADTCLRSDGWKATRGRRVVSGGRWRRYDRFAVRVLVDEFAASVPLGLSSGGGEKARRSAIHRWCKSDDKVSDSRANSFPAHFCVGLSKMLARIPMKTENIGKDHQVVDIIAACGAPPRCTSSRASRRTKGVTLSSACPSGGRGENRQLRVEPTPKPGPHCQDVGDSHYATRATMAQRRRGDRYPGSIGAPRPCFVDHAFPGAIPVAPCPCLGLSPSGVLLSGTVRAAARWPRR